MCVPLLFCSMIPTIKMLLSFCSIILNASVCAEDQAYAVLRFTKRAKVIDGVRKFHWMRPLFFFCLSSNLYEPVLEQEMRFSRLFVLFCRKNLNGMLCSHTCLHLFAYQPIEICQPNHGKNISLNRVIARANFPSCLHH